MTRLVHSLFNISYLEELARRKNWLNDIHGLSKLLVTIVYILSVSSAGKYELNEVLLLMVYPVFILTSVDIPLKALLRKMFVPIILGASLGILNPLLDKNVVVVTSQISISAGWLSFLVLFLKATLCITSAFLLVSTTPIEEIVGALNVLKLPKVMSVQVLLMFRYITILVQEFERALTAYSLRSGGGHAIEWRAWGSFMGQIFIRTSERSYRLYDSMKLRGFNGNFDDMLEKKFKPKDAIYILIWLMVLLVIHFK